MKVIKLRGMTLTVKYLYRNHGLYWYKRRIPKPLLKHFGGVTVHQKSLETSDLAEATRRALKETEHLDGLFKALRDPNLSSLTSPPVISLLSARFGDPLEASPDFELSPAALLGDELQDRWRTTLRADGAELGLSDVALDAWVERETKRRDETVEIARVASPSELAFLAMGNHGTPFLTLVDLKRAYLEAAAKRSGTSVSREKSASVVIKSFAEYVGGEKTLVKTINSDHVQGWIDHVIKNGSKPTTAERMLKQLKAIFRGGLDNEKSHFKKVYVPGLVDYEGRRYSPTFSDARRILDSLKDDPIVVLVVLLGCRINEIAGLRSSDVFLEEDVPFLRIIDHPGRRLKTAASNRDVPLVGGALSAATFIRNSQSDEEYFLPKYGRTKTGGDVLGQYVNTRTKVIDSRITSHCFRHLLKDLLREAGAQESLANELQGHANQGHGARYGRGYSLRLKAEWMKKAYDLIGANL